MNRSALIDGIKALASQLIVLHHLSLYAPMTDWIADAWPRLVAFLYDDGRYAVQPFLVIGGFLTAQSLGKRRGLAPVPLIWQRYLRLVPQFLVALALVVAATRWLGQELAQQDWVSPLPSVGQFLAHLFFLQDVLGVLQLKDLTDSLAGKPEYKDVLVLKLDYDGQKDDMRSLGAQNRSTLIAFKGAEETGRSVADTDPASVEKLFASTLGQ